MDYNAFSRVIVSTIAMSTLFLLVGGWDAHGERISLETVRVGNPGNAGELSGKGAGGYGVDRVCGRVAYRYNIGKYEVTNTQYAAFLNAVDAEGKNPHGIYNPGMGVDPRGGILLDGASPAGGMYSAKRHMGNKPVIFVSWLSAIRFANWLHNGQPTDGSGTEDGAYTMRPGVIDARNPGAKWFLPSEDEWYKAAYHKNDGTTGNYWEYPTVSDTPPITRTATAARARRATGRTSRRRRTGTARMEMLPRWARTAARVPTALSIRAAMSGNGPSTLPDARRTVGVSCAEPIGKLRWPPSRGLPRGWITEPRSRATGSAFA